ncbi:hypothetical protein GCM10010503_09140 [Streptomyces lucensis JCM 4490]|uniref:2Fe-2S ferredoxin-type domain-containing protein n=1 Tax=Streptomyces lucensis JCM 4490 TaxID=1306176 RepID=A0A918IXK4_9ACTN|nr:(2Fe-2S)-binding protein [Streptomyces lucensis]GGW35593.1 hypothetical protein GCM10010503_09140 [Streptomyces lucensis JCM 4490]
MSDDQHGEGTSQGGGRWDPLPQGDYDDGATAFVKLPEGGIDALLSGDSPLAAPGHGYVPPQITVAPGTGDPATGTWAAPAGGAQWPDPNAAGQARPGDADDRFTYQPGATQHWTFEEPPAPAAPGHDVTGQWSIPVAGGDLPDESGEFTTSSLVEQWGGTPPPTLPGGAPAPWATDGTDHTWTQPGEPRTGDARHAEPHTGDVRHADPQAPDRVDAPLPDHTGAHPAGSAPDAYAGAAPDGYAVEERHERGPAGHAAEGHGEGGHDEDGRGGHGGQGGHGGTGPAPTAHAGAGQAGAGEGDTPGAVSGRTEPGAHAAPAQDGAPEPAPVPRINAHHPVEASEGPAEGSTAPDKAEGPATGPETATRPETAEPAAAPADGGAAEPEDPTGDGAAPGPDDLPGARPGEADEAGDPAAAPPAPHDEHPLASYVLRVNGADRPVTDAWIGESLLYVLRERLGLAGAKDGCSQGECGACNVQVDGRLVASCLVPAVTAAGSEVRTVEGLAADGQPSDVQRALARCGAVQCGFCVPGMAMTVHDLLEGNPAPTELETRQALCGNLCRCSGYRGVLEAVKEVVAEREASHAAPEPDAEQARIPHQAGPGSGGVNPSAFEAPGAFDTPRTPGGHPAPQDPYGDPADLYGDPYGDAPDAYGGPGDPYGAPGPHDQHYGQDGGQA